MFTFLAFFSSWSTTKKKWERTKAAFISINIFLFVIENNDEQLLWFACGIQKGSFSLIFSSTVRLMSAIKTGQRLTAALCSQHPGPCLLYTCLRKRCLPIPHLPGWDYTWLKHFWKEKECTKSISRKKPFNLVIFVLLQGWIRGTFYSSCQVIFQTAFDIHRIAGWARNMQNQAFLFSCMVPECR